MKLRDLEILAAVVESGGMRRAAERLHLSQPAVSKSVAALEAALGTSLLDRSRRGVEVTRSGAAVLARSRAMFDELRQGLSDLERLADPEAGEVRLACGGSIAAGLVAAAVASMADSHPRVRIAVESGDSHAVLAHTLAGRRADLAIARAHGAPDAAAFAIEPLFQERLVAVVDPASPWAARKRLALRDLADASWILSPHEAEQDSPVARAFRSAGVPMPDATLVTNSLGLRCALLATGRYVTVMPESLLRWARLPGRVRTLTLDIGAWEAPMAIVTLANRTLSAPAVAFSETVRRLAATLRDP